MEITGFVKIQERKEIYFCRTGTHKEKTLRQALVWCAEVFREYDEDSRRILFQKDICVIETDVPMRHKRVWANEFYDYWRKSFWLIISALVLRKNNDSARCSVLLRIIICYKIVEQMASFSDRVTKAVI